MTKWLVNQLVNNAKAPITEAIRENFTSRDIRNKSGAMQAWTAMVVTGAMWDFKVDIQRTKWFNAGERDVVFGEETLNWDAVANIHYGFVGRAAGFEAEFLVQAAGAAQWMRFQDTKNPDDKGVCNLKCYCDHPFATWSIQFGIYLYEQIDGDIDALDEDKFKYYLGQYIEEVGEPPDPPLGALE